MCTCRFRMHPWDPIPRPRVATSTGMWRPVARTFLMIRSSGTSSWMSTRISLGVACLGLVLQIPSRQARI
ncbi:hypothetical protein MT325_m710R [Paramecium bursaria chlorella virus MT325]|uniref:Uncharacterized protein m710R n=1 Tax=Paramecium bursaria Chlorella virus MT325 TaxID=346932 RepID=A7IV90_PBCVM|nr:hypothetical protein MT325_m710R [Paramecium bursaria chlorella virus MT325]